MTKEYINSKIECPVCRRDFAKNYLMVQLSLKDTPVEQQYKLNPFISELYSISNNMSAMVNTARINPFIFLI